MTLVDVKNSSAGDRDHIFDVLKDAAKPCSVSTIRIKLKKRGVNLPDYLITRNLRSLLSEGKAQLNRRKWSTSSSFEHRGTSNGYAPIQIEIPIDISNEFFAMSFSNELFQ